MSEILKPTPHALIARFTYESQDRQIVQKVEQFSLTPGSGIVFYGEEDQTSIAAAFQQSEIEFVLNTLKQGPGTLQLLTLLDSNSGGLLLSDNAGNAWGINSSIPKGKRHVGASYGRLHFAGIWGESKDEVSETLRRLQDARINLN